MSNKAKKGIEKEGGIQKNVIKQARQVGFTNIEKNDKEKKKGEKERARERRGVSIKVKNKLYNYINITSVIII